ncbi:MAG: acetamidase/formamidase family protein [Atopobiaceae bacterium]|nr:acetamidase/formamidase family protein [Atopobiaceae bacterium]
MQVAGCERTYNVHSRDNEPAIVVEPGEVFRVRTQLNGGGWLASEDDQWDPSKSRGPNLSVVIGVAGAVPGDTLAVDILAVEPGPLAYTGFAGWRNPLSQRVWPNDWDVVTKTVRVEDGLIRWSDALQIPVRPMIGTLGVAPAGEPVSNQVAGRHGGNMDVQEVRAGTTVYLPVEVEGALLHVGDLHAAMGDDEVAHSALECAGEVELRVRLVHEDRRGRWLRMEDERHIMAVACDPDMQTALTLAMRELVSWMSDGFGFDPREAYLLLGSVMEARSTLIHGYEGYPITYICKIAKEYLRPDPAFVPYRGEMPREGRRP